LRSFTHHSLPVAAGKDGITNSGSAGALPYRLAFGLFHVRVGHRIAKVNTEIRHFVQRQRSARPRHGAFDPEEIGAFHLIENERGALVVFVRADIDIVETGFLSRGAT